MPAYNNYFPLGYNPMSYYNPQQSYAQPQPQQMQPSSSIVWVQGEAGAKAYPIAPGTTMLLMDSEGECFYIKSTDPSGMPLPLKTYHYEEVINQRSENSYAQPQLTFNPDEFAKKEDFQRLEKRIDELSAKPMQSKKEKMNNE